MIKLNEIFYSLQGEGAWSGTPMVFVRLSGCNLRCKFCDTDFESFHELSAAEIALQARKLGGDCRFLCITGGEPSLQLSDELVSALHEAGFTIHLETNGTREIPEGIDWVTVSPKQGLPGVKGNAQVKIQHIDEVKLVFIPGQNEQFIQSWLSLPAVHYFLQPCDFGEISKNKICLEEAVKYIKKHPQWSLSLQMHKILGIK